jgi:hypothetical protein
VTLSNCSQIGQKTQKTPHKKCNFNGNVFATSFHYFWYFKKKIKIMFCIFAFCNFANVERCNTMLMWPLQKQQQQWPYFKASQPLNSLLPICLHSKIRIFRFLNIKDTPTTTGDTIFATMMGFCVLAFFHGPRVAQQQQQQQQRLHCHDSFNASCDSSASPLWMLVSN